MSQWWPSAQLPLSWFTSLLLGIEFGLLCTVSVLSNLSTQSASTKKESTPHKTKKWCKPKIKEGGVCCLKGLVRTLVTVL